MALRIYDFKKYDGYAIENEGDTERYMLYIYLSGKSNTLATICRHDKQEGSYSLYNFILDKEHLNNMKKAKINWFEELSGIVLNVDKITTDIKLFIDYALHCNCNVILMRGELI